MSKIRIFLLIYFIIHSSLYRRDILITSDFFKISNIPKDNYTELYNETIEYIKEHEGFSDTVYICPALKKTIGWGHLLTKKDSLLNKISKTQADELLKKDFNKAINFVKSKTNLEGSKLLAMSHFVFCLGSGNFMKGPYKQLKNNEEPIIILKYCHYKKDSLIIKSTNLYNQRNWELKMFKKENI